MDVCVKQDRRYQSFIALAAALSLSMLMAILAAQWFTQPGITQPKVILPIRKTTTISGVVFNDTSRYGVWTSGVAITMPAVVTLYRYDPSAGQSQSANVDQTGALVSATVTAEGWYTFTGVESGGLLDSYVVSVSGPGGYVNTTPLSRVVRPVTNNQHRIDFGLALFDGTSQVLGVAYEDANNDGHLTPGEHGIAGLTVLVDGDAHYAATTTVDGLFSLPVAEPNNYTIHVIAPEDSLATVADLQEVALTENTASELRFGFSTRPNILLIISDDQTYDTVVVSSTVAVTSSPPVSETFAAPFMPFTQQQIFNSGASFVHAYDTTPMCCPSRASMLTGQYAHHNGVIDNYTPLKQTTIISYLHQAGYFTGLVGKYLNSYLSDYLTPTLVPPEFDFWAHRCEAGEKTASVDKDPYCYRYTSARFNVVGASVKLAPNSIITGSPYVTVGAAIPYTPYVERDFALDFLHQAMYRPKPFTLVFATLVAHRQVGQVDLGDKNIPYPAPDERNLLTDTLSTAANTVLKHRPPSFNEADVSDKPFYMQNAPPIDIASSDDRRLNMLNSLQALDRIVVSLTMELSQSGMLTNTVVIFISDNGYLFGEHRAIEKAKVYEESSHVPFAIRYSGWLTTSRVVSDLVANIDIAPTISELARITQTMGPMDGRSLVPYLRAAPGVTVTPVHTYVILEGQPTTDPINPPYVAIHDADNVYVENLCDLREFYALNDTPMGRWQLTNTYKPNGTPAQVRLQRTLDEMENTWGPEHVGGYAAFSQCPGKIYFPSVPAGAP